MLGLVAMFVASTLGAAGQTNTLEAQFQAANQLVAQGKFAEGAEAYAKLPVGNRTSMALEYNRGLAHARSGELGRAQAHLLRAERLAPRNAAVQAALSQVSAKLPAQANNTFSGPLEWTDRLTLNEWGGLALLGVWAWGVLLLLGRWRPALSAPLRGYTIGVGCLAVIITGLTIAAWVRRAHLPDALVLRPDTVVRVSPLEEARPAFSLAEGARVRSSEAPNGWLLVEEPSTRRFGWVKADAIARLPLL
ncbi:MAG TPA: hypothetical protein PLX89_11100 [Verrucomicrobiota bacterium]|nr:hypothetical protein [Verrucomicrobiales bacterium]HRI13543.1 hypothetical protein [Verrucomicrobiota bacterium]